MKHQQQHQESAPPPHPMVSVPEALRIVLRETARFWIQQRQHQQDDARNYIMLPLQQLVVGQRLAENVYMPEPGYPAYRASVMDGYCIRTSDYDKYYGSSNGRSSNNNSHTAQQHQFLVVDRVHAGDDDEKQQTVHVDSSHHLPTACYITTGALVPDSYDCVIPVEEVQVMQQQQQTDTNNSNDNAIRTTTTTTSTTIITIVSPTTTNNISPGQWIRGKGCDIAAGSLVLPKHHVLNAISIGLLYQVLGSSALAAASVRVAIQPRIRVGILSTGNEIYDVNDSTSDDAGMSSSLSTGKIPDVNRLILLSLLQQHDQDAASSPFPFSWKDCCQGIDLGMVRDDDVNVVASRLQTAMETCDVVITTGGISMGETDIIEHVLVDKLGGKLHFGRLHMKPGKPTTFVTFEPQNHQNGQKKKKLAMVFAMPGNPVSATVCTLLLVQPAVRFLYYGAADESSVYKYKYGDSVDNAWLDRAVENAIVHVEVQARLAQDLPLDVERPEYHRVRLDYHHTHTHSTLSAAAAPTSDKTTTTTTTRMTNITAISTGVQRSSRLLSLLDADGLAVLPQAVKGNNDNDNDTSNGGSVAAAGSICTILLLRNPYGIPAATVGTSLHLNSHPLSSSSSKKKALVAQSTKPPLCIGIIRIKPNQGGSESSSNANNSAAMAADSTSENDHDQIVSDMVQTALSGSKRGSASVVSFHAYTAANMEPNGLYNFMQKVKNYNFMQKVKKSTSNIDVMVIIGPTTTAEKTPSSSRSSFLYHTATANALRQQLSKTADALAMQAKRGAASQDPKAALYETVVGYLNDKNDVSSSNSGASSNDGVLVIFLSPLGLEGGLCNVRGLLKHARQIARGGADGQQHHHQE